MVKQFKFISKRMIRLFAFIYLNLIATAFVFTQSAHNSLRKGNKMYAENRYNASDSLYRLALKKDSLSVKALFNLGDALYKQGKFDEAADVFKKLEGKSNDNNINSQINHNLGNCYLQSKKYKEAIDSYKKALRNNPADEDTRYNLSYAQKMLKQQEQQQQQQQNDQQQQKDEQKDKQQNESDKENKKDKQEDKEQDKENEKNKKKNENESENQKEQNKQPKDQQISKEQSEKILDAINNEEKKVQDKLKKKSAKGIKVNTEKDW